MHRRALVSLGVLAAFGVAGCASRSVSDPQAVLQQADAATGASQVKTLRFAANGTGGIFGQAYVPGEPWPRINVPTFVRWIDYDNAAMREDSVRTRAEPNGGGALPLMGTGEQRVS